MPPKVAKARANNAKYSEGPNFKANLAKIGASMTKPMVAIKLPIKEAIAEIAKASAALPFTAMG